MQAFCSHEREPCPGCAVCVALFGFLGSSRRNSRAGFGGGLAVPELPRDEAQLGDKTLRALLRLHRENKSCAACHDKFDFAGLVFEGYGPIGQRRDRDLGDRPVDTQTTFPDGTTGAGLTGLQRYLSGQRQAQFVDNLCRKLLAYGLGRTLILSDDPTIDEMKQTLADHDHRFSSLIDVIVTSRQFLNKRPEQRAVQQQE